MYRIFLFVFTTLLLLISCSQEQKTDTEKVDLRNVIDTSKHAPNSSLGKSTNGFKEGDSQVDDQVNFSFSKTLSPFHSIEMPNTESASITGGFVYRGSALPALQGRGF